MSVFAFEMKTIATLVLLLASLGAVPAAVAAPSVLLVSGAEGEETYRDAFLRQTDQWKAAAARGGAVATVAETREDVRVALEQEKSGNDPLWVVLIGHGTWDGKVARFNVRGDDLTADDLAAWLAPVKRPLAVLNLSASSAPFLAKLSGPDRLVVTATRSGSEQNYARLGEFLAPALTDPAADMDADGAVSLLEAVLTAAGHTVAYYKSDGRLVTEHALIDDNGDGAGTPAEWFRGLRPTKKPQNAAAVDGARARQFFLVPSAGDEKLTADQKKRRDALEQQISALREAKAEMKEDVYYGRLEALLRQLAALYGQSATDDARSP